MNDRERLRLFDALLGEGLAIADGEAGSDNELVRRWAVKVAQARREYHDDVDPPPAQHVDPNKCRCLFCSEEAPQRR